MSRRSAPTARAARLVAGAWKLVRTPRGLAWLALGIALTVALATGAVEVEHRLKALEAWIAHLGPYAIVVFVAAYALLTTLLVPDTPLRLAAGALFGFGGGVAAASAGVLIGSFAQFALGRRLGPRVTRLVDRRPTLSALRLAVLQEGVRLQLLVRLTPVNHAIVTYAFAAAGVRLVPFLLALPGLLPSIVIEVLAGYAGRHAVRLAGGDGPAGASDYLPFVALGVGAVALVLASRAAHRAVKRAMAEPVDSGGA